MTQIPEPADLADSDLGRSAVLAQALAELTNTLVRQFDVVEFLHKLTTYAVLLAGANAAGVVLADTHGDLHVIASSTEQTRLLELFEVQGAQGPCLDAYRAAAAVQASGTAAAEQWPQFAPAAFQLGFQTMAAVPLALEDESIGALNLLHVSEQPFTDGELFTARAMADIAAIGLLQERALRESRMLSAQLQHALTSRIDMEHAKGAIVHQMGLTPDEAFELTRQYARHTKRGLVDVAHDIASKRLTAADLAPRTDHA
jgi:GAF domain-containing protein